MSKYTKEMLEPLVKESKSYTQIIRKLGLKVSGGSSAFIKDKILLFEIDTSHFTGSLWSKGTTKENNPIVKQQAEKMRIDPKTILKQNTHYKGRILKETLLSIGIKYECKECGRGPEWNNKPLSLHTDHINGNRRDNRQSNLRFLCPNCHQQTPTWGRGSSKIATVS